jgi:hypothetical protein
LKVLLRRLGGICFFSWFSIWHKTWKRMFRIPVLFRPVVELTDTFHFNFMKALRHVVSPVKSMYIGCISYILNLPWHSKTNIRFRNRYSHNKRKKLPKWTQKKWKMGCSCNAECYC